jgi:FtsX-like permease family/MacB-like periplasmic core domain
VTLASLFRLALGRVLERPLRSFLLLQGTVWAVAVAVYPTAVVAGTREAARVRGTALGADRVSLAPDPTSQTAPTFDADDLEAVGAALRAAAAPPRALGGARVEQVWPLADGPAALLAATPEAPRARGLSLSAGRWLTADDPPDACVVESGVGAWLGRPGLGPGDTLALPGRPAPLHVVGVIAARSETLRHANDLGFDVTHPLYRKVGRPLLFALGIPRVEDDWKRSERVVWVPWKGGALDWIFLRAATADVRAAARRAADALVARGRSPVALHALVLPFLMGREVDRFGAVQIALFLACLAMGAVVMANLGLLTVMQRTREIAVRRVEGARRRDIALQLLLEGLLLTAAGAALGCLLGAGLAWLRVVLEPVTGFAWVFPWTQALVAVGVALAVGVLASLLPALRAAAQQPVEGLVEE